VADYYDVLGVARGADAATIKQAFRARARELHPDVSPDPDAEEKFRSLADAYAALSKPASRLLYDRFGYRGPGAWTASPAAGQAFTGLFEHWARAKRRQRAGGEVAELELGFYEAARGGTRRVSYSSRGPCPSCSPGAETQLCATCAGRGYVRESDDAGSVRMLQLMTCSDCSGSGRTGWSACGDCGGTGEIETEREAEVTFASGVEDGTTLPLEDADGPQVVVRVEEQPRDSAAVRGAAAIGLAAAVAFLLFLLLG
jgi:molecular chaperone DnaJ